jgi:type IV pilus assembly protein PilO
MNKLFQKLNAYSLQQILVFGIVAGLIYYFLLFDDGASYSNQIAQFNREIAAEEEKKKDTDANVKEEARIKESVGQLSRQYQEISRQLPTSLSSIDINRGIDAFARNAGVSIKARKPLANVQQAIVDQIPIQVSLEGTFSQLAQFVYLVSGSERATAVSYFKMEPISPRNTRLRFEGVVTGYQLSSTPATDSKGGNR